MRGSWRHKRRPRRSERNMERSQRWRSNGEELSDPFSFSPRFDRVPRSAITSTGVLSPPTDQLTISQAVRIRRSFSVRPRLVFFPLSLSGFLLDSFGAPPLLLGTDDIFLGGLLSLAPVFFRRGHGPSVQPQHATHPSKCPSDLLEHPHLLLRPLPSPFLGHEEHQHRYQHARSRYVALTSFRRAKGSSQRGDDNDLTPFFLSLLRFLQSSTPSTTTSSSSGKALGMIPALGSGSDSSS